MRDWLTPRGVASSSAATKLISLKNSSGCHVRTVADQAQAANAMSMAAVDADEKAFVFHISGARQKWSACCASLFPTFGGEVNATL